MSLGSGYQGPPINLDIRYPVRIFFTDGKVKVVEVKRLVFMRFLRNMRNAKSVRKVEYNICDFWYNF